jgi:predicted HD superfamily hydrolase involved in NAD metabolism
VAAAANHEELRILMAPELPAGVVEHIDRVVVVAAELAKQHGLDERRALLAAQGHDLLRAMAPEAWLEAAAARSLEVSDLEREAPVLLHGPLGAIELEQRGWVDDVEVLHAIHWHTTGHPDYGPVAWATFVADKVEPGKLLDWPALQAVAELAEESLEEAALLYLDLNRRKAARQGWTVHPMAEETRKVLRERVRVAHR